MRGKIYLALLSLVVLMGFTLPQPDMTKKKHDVSSTPHLLVEPLIDVLPSQYLIKRWLSFNFFPSQTSRGYWTIAKPNGNLQLFNPYVKKNIWNQWINVVPTAAFSVGQQKLFLPTSQARLCAFILADGTSSWCSPLGALAFSPAAVSGGNVFIQANNDSIYAFSVLDGHIKWNVHFSQPQPVLAMHASPVLGQQYVWAVLRNGRLVAINKNSGVVYWRHILAPVDISLTAQTGAEFNLSPVLSHGIIVASAYAGGVWAWDIKHLKEYLWHFPLSGLVAMVAYNQQIILLDGDANIISLSIRSGHLLWRKHFNHPADFNPYRLIVLGNRLWIKGYNDVKSIALLKEKG